MRSLIKRRRPIAVVVFVMLAVSCGGAPAPPPQPIPAAAPQTSTVAQPVLDPTELLVVADVYELFAEAGLGMPHVPVAFHQDVLSCGGNLGRHRVFSDGAIIVEVCMRHEIAEIQQIGRRRILIHEMAHVYLDHALTDDQRDEFLDLRGLTSWGSGPWEARGAEHAAELVLWGLTDLNIDVQLDQDSCEELTSGVELLLGPVDRMC